MNTEQARLLTPEQAAELLTITVGTLGVWRSTRRYPLPFVKIGRSVRYRLGDVQAFINNRTAGADDTGE